MKKQLVFGLAMVMVASSFMACGDTSKKPTAPETEPEAVEISQEDADQVAADNCAALIDAIYVQERNDSTDEQCRS